MNSIEGDQSEGRDAQPLDLSGDHGAHPGKGDSAERLDLDEEDRLPWLETADDDYDEGGVDGARVFGFVLAGVVGLAAIVGAIWFFTHRAPDPNQAANGAIIAAPSEPYKQQPRNPGGKTFAGTGDTSFAVSAGQTRPAHLGGADGGQPDSSGAATTPAPKPSVDVSGKPGAAAATVAPSHGAAAPASASGAAPAAGTVGVQVGAFSSKTTAEAAWTRLSGQYAPLKGLSHRVVEGSADIGTVYRLQAVSASGAAADALCGQLKVAGLACQVKR